MSDRLIESVDQLRVATEALIQELRAFRTREAPPAPGYPADHSRRATGSADTIVLEELARVPFPDHFSAEVLRQTYRTAEEGPPEVPQPVYDICSDRLSGKAPGPVSRATQAFRAGFWAKVAIQTHTPYHPPQVISGLRANHWIVLRSAFGEPFRTTSKREADRIARSLEDAENLLIESFNSITELEVFCFGALTNVPPLRSCSVRD